MYEEQFSKRLTELRTQKGVSARDMSLSIGQNPGYIRAIESGTAFPLKQFDAEQINALTAFIKTIVKK